MLRKPLSRSGFEPSFHLELRSESIAEELQSWTLHFASSSKSWCWVTVSDRLRALPRRVESSVGFCFYLQNSQVFFFVFQVFPHNL